MKKLAMALGVFGLLSFTGVLAHAQDADKGAAGDKAEKKGKKGKKGKKAEGDAAGGDAAGGDKK
jgi:hypothetical protein